MDPATIAGLVLGAIPLLISAIENYETTFQPFVTYHHHIKEIRRFTARLDTQRAIFHNECQLLLASVGQSLQDILRDPSHPARQDDELSNRLEELLGTSYNTCVSTLNLINETLAAVSDETKGFKELLDGKASKGKASWSMFRQKIKISFSKTRLNEIVNELRLYNEDLGRLSAQIRKLSTQQPTTDTVVDSKLSHIQVTQQASIRLFDVLSAGWASEDCGEHRVTMCLRVEDRCQNSASKVRFNMAVTCAQQTIETKSFWLAIESAPGDASEKGTLQSETTALRLALHKSGAVSRSVKFDLPSTRRSASSSKTQILLAPYLDLYAMGRLCQYFRQASIQTEIEPCLGFLEKSKTFKHFVYPPQASRPVLSPSNSSSLKEVLQAVSSESKEQDWVEKLSLAKILSLAVLRFHSTPWLSENWSSNDVHLMNPASTLADPCVEVPLTSPKLHMLNSSSLAPNETLFNLGVILGESKCL